MEAYCGPAPVPSTLSGAWNADAVALVLCAALLAAKRRGGDGIGWPLAAGLVWLLVLFVSPLCALTTALFSARATHHLLLIAVVAPMLALAFPARARAPLGAPAALQALVLWAWHVPQLYAAAIGPPALYWTMQLSLLGSAVWFWRGVLGAAAAGPALLALGLTIVQMGMLGALLTFAAVPLYGPHLATTAAFGLDALEDQRLAGLIMWVPAALPYLLAALLLLARRLPPDIARPQMG
jgi:putative membrane protein